MDLHTIPHPYSIVIEPLMFSWAHDHLELTTIPSPVCSSLYSAGDEVLANGVAVEAVLVLLGVVLSVERACS